MTNVRIVQLSIRASFLALGIALFAWRASIDWSLMTPREVRDALQASLFIALAGQAFGAAPRPGAPGVRVVVAPPATLVAGLLGLAIGGIFIFNGYLASQHLACRQRVLAEASTGSSPATATDIAKCFQ